ncbi:hypothetical protein IFM89_012440 [Coptis chinensis]|uniref:O-fucosyltransferase family protein n=1 Tax=Coptis chinensis TaxID=261450 RepID=A0A835IBU1_9MAGN|nr:hypothetical protein IFM89_012440 [Coptis chinensis]
MDMALSKLNNGVVAEQWGLSKEGLEVTLVMVSNRDSMLDVLPNVREDDGVMDCTRQLKQKKGCPFKTKLHHGPTVGVIECPKLHSLKSEISVLNDFPCVSIPCNASDSQYQALGWQIVAAKMCCIFTVVKREDFSIKICTSDIFFSRALRDQQQCQYSGFADVFDVDYFIQEMKNYITVLKTVPEEIALREPNQVDFAETYPLYAKAALCQGCYKTLRLTESLEKKGSSFWMPYPNPFCPFTYALNDMVAYINVSTEPLSFLRNAISSAQGVENPDREMAHIWRSRGKCPLTPNETAFILKALAIPTSTTIYLVAGDGLMEIDGLTSVYTNVYTKSSLLSGQDFTRMHGNTKAALDYYVSVNSWVDYELQITLRYFSVAGTLGQL